MMNRNTAVTLGMAGIIALSMAASSFAAVPTNTTVVKATAPDTMTDVRWRGRWGGWRGSPGWWGPGVVIGGLALGAPYGYASPYYYGGPYWGGYPGYWGSQSTCWDRGRRSLCPGSG